MIMKAYIYIKMWILMNWLCDRHQTWTTDNIHRAANQYILTDLYWETLSNTQ